MQHPVSSRCAVQSAHRRNEATLAQQEQESTHQVCAVQRLIKEVEAKKVAENIAQVTQFCLVVCLALFCVSRRGPLVKHQPHICGAPFKIEHLLFSLTPTLTITCTCCYVVINGIQNLKIYSHADSRSRSLLRLGVSVAVCDCIEGPCLCVCLH